MPIDVQDRGAKHRCFQCQTLFYDLKRPKLVCPRCGADQADEPKVKPAAKKSRKPAPAPVAPVNAAPEEEEAEDEVAVPEPDDDEDEDEPEDADD